MSLFMQYYQSVLFTFSQLSLTEKKSWPSFPDLQLIKTSSSRKSTYQTKFNPQIYSKHNWICGCEVKNALFCFPCLLFGGDAAWTKTGVTDLGHLPEKNEKHKNSAKHIRNVSD
jgi:hypothetical protein